MSPVSNSSDLMLSFHEAFIYSRHKKKGWRERESNGDELEVIVLPE